MTIAIKPAKTRRKSKTKVVKIPTEAHAHLVELAADQERSMGDLLADLIEQGRRRAFMEAANEDYARLKADPEAWADYWSEFKEWETADPGLLKDYPWEE